jgi:hypothetical protein
MPRPTDRPWIDSSSSVDLHYKALLESDYLGQWDLVNRTTGKLIEPVVTIQALRPYVPERRKMVRRADGSERPEPIKRYEIRFVGKKKIWLAGPVSLAALATMYGAKPKAWVGKSITLYVDESVSFGRRRTGGIRVRNTVPTGPAGDEELNNEVDAEAAAGIAEAFGDEEAGAPAGPRAAPAPRELTGGRDTGREPGEEG